MDTTNKLAVGGRYNWKGQRERLVYIGRNWSGNGYWHQFELVGRPGVVWCEVVDADLGQFEESPSDAAQATQAVSEPVAMQPAEAVAWDRILRSSVPERWKGCTSPVGAVQSYIAELEQALIHRGIDLDELEAHPAPASASEPEQPYTYASRQATNCACCGEHKHTPLRIDAMDGYVCLTCIDNKLGSLLGEFGYPEPASVAGAGEALPVANVLALISTYASAIREGGYCPSREERAEIDSLAERVKASVSALAARPVADGEARMLAYELDGVITDVEQGNGFDEVCLRTIKRVAAALARQAPAPLRDPRMEKFDREGPLPGMIAAFELQFGQSWTDKDWRDEASTWAKAWKAALATAPLSQAVPEAPVAKVWMKDGEIQKAATYMPGLPDGEHELYTEPQPQAVTEDARDGERLDWLERDMQAGDEGVGIEFATGRFGFPYLVNGDRVGGGGVGWRGFKSLRAAIDDARAATRGSEGEGRG